MKKLLIITLMLAISSCASKVQDVDPTGFSAPKETKTVASKPVSKSTYTAKNKPIYIASVDDEQYQEDLKRALRERIETEAKFSAFFAMMRQKQAKSNPVKVLQPEAPVMEEPVQNLKPLNPELTLQEKLYNATIKPVRKQLLKWNMYINKEVPKYMKILKNEPSVWVILISLFAAFVYGIIHTLGPGHGKMVIATYFLTQQASIWQGIWLGLQTAFAHVGGAIVLVLVTDVALRSLVLDPAKHMYLLKNISFSLIIVVGSVMLVQAVLHALGFIKKHGCSHCGHKPTKKPTKRETLIALSIGCIPCTGSLLILLYAMANDILAFGLLMVIFVAIGMALTMIIIGLIAIWGKKTLLDKYFTGGKSSHKYSKILEITGAIFIITIGLLLLSVNI